jgi:nucleotide-binding universal stress UspA family protein
MTRKPIIVGVDGSAESVRAAVVAHHLAGAIQAPCLFVYAAPELWPPGLAPLALLPGMYDGVRQQLLDGLRAALPDIEASALIVRTGRAGKVLVDEASRRGAMLVAVGGRRHGALTRGLGGSTAHYLARALDVPLLSVSPTSELPRRVLVAVDLSDACGPTLKAAARYATALGAPLRALHVIEPVRFPGVLPVPIDESEIERQSREAFERALAAVPAARDLLADRVVVRGPAAEAIAEAAAAGRVDLIVVGSHGKGWTNRMLIGSTTERLLNLLPTSVLVVPITKQRAGMKRARRQPRRGVVVV